MLETTFGYAQLDGGQSFYETAGHGDDLILLHAGFVDSCMWDDQWETLTQHHRVTRFDLRGFGKSSVADRQTARREELHLLLNYLEIKQAHLLGCSLGGTIALDFTLAHPERVTSLILVSTLPSGFENHVRPSQKFLEMMAALERHELGWASELQLQLWLDGPLHRQKPIDPQIRQRVAEMNQVALANKTLLHVDANPIDPLMPPALNRLNEINVPTFIMTGELDDPTMIVAADALSVRIRQAQKLLISDCGPMINMEKPQEFTHAVLNFLATVS